MDVNLRIRSFWDDLRSSLWFRPGVTTLLAVTLAFVATGVDRNGVYPSGYDLSPDNARSILSTIAGSMLSVVTMTFSIIMVVLVLASQQFSPRILRNFIRDQTSQNILSIFIGTFVYCLLVMLRISDNGKDIFVPVWAVLIAIALALISMAALVYFIDHIAKQTRVSYILAEINRQTVSVMRKARKERSRYAASEDETAPAPDAPREAVRIYSQRVGYVQAIDFAEIVRLASDADLTVQLLRAVGDFVSVHGDFLLAWPADHLPDGLDEKLYALFDIGPERTLMEDQLLGMQQLVDIALKAMSPSVNDPNTAVNCIHYMTNLLIQAAESPDLPMYYKDEEGEIRVICHQSSFEAMVDLAFSQLRHYAAGDMVVMARMLEALYEIALGTTGHARLEVLWRHARLIVRTIATQETDALARQRINTIIKRLARQVGQAAENIMLNVHAN